MNFALSMPRFWRRLVATTLFAALLICFYALSGKTSPRDDSTEIPVAQSPPLPFDLVVVERDMNGLPLNPKWGAQVTNPGTFPNPLDYQKCPNYDFTGPQCSSPSQIKWVNKATYNAPICVWGQAGPHRKNGHVNWAAATYTGSICWAGPSMDGDYDWSLKPDDNAGLTLENAPRPTTPGAPKSPQYIHVEFDAEETTDAPFATPLWNMFRRYLDPVCGGAAYTCDEAKGREMVDGRRAIVTGLLGLDSEHGGYSELHPVYAMAIETKPNPADPNDDNWMVFARNWGNEGYCSGKTETLSPELTSVKIVLPEPEVTNGEITGVDITSNFDSLDTNDCPTAVFIKGKGVVLSFSTPTVNSPTVPIRRPLIEGEVHLRWHSTGTIHWKPVVPCEPQLKQEFLQDQRELERSLIGRVLKVKERFAYFEIQREQQRDLFNTAAMKHCSALSGPLNIMNLDKSDVSTVMVSPPPPEQGTSKALPKKKGGRRVPTKLELMRTAIRRATRKSIH